MIKLKIDKIKMLGELYMQVKEFTPYKPKLYVHVYYCIKSLFH